MGNQLGDPGLPLTCFRKTLKRPSPLEVTNLDSDSEVGRAASTSGLRSQSSSGPSRGVTKRLRDDSDLHEPSEARVEPRLAQADSESEGAESRHPKRARS
jgi:hypothetical protein